MWRDSLYVTCGLTACTPGSAPGPTLGNEYGKTVHFTFSANFTAVCIWATRIHDDYCGNWSIVFIVVFQAGTTGMRMNLSVTVAVCMCTVSREKSRWIQYFWTGYRKLSFVHAVAAENTKEKVNFFRVFKVHGYILQVRWTKAKLLTSNWNFFGVFGSENYWQRFISDLVAQEGIGWRFLRLMVYLSNQWLEYVGRLSGVTMGRGAVAPGRSRRGDAKQPR